MFYFICFITVIIVVLFQEREDKPSKLPPFTKEEAEMYYKNELKNNYE